MRNAMISSARLQRRPLNCAAGVGKIWEARKRPELERRRKKCTPPEKAAVQSGVGKSEKKVQE